MKILIYILITSIGIFFSSTVNLNQGYSQASNIDTSAIFLSSNVYDYKNPQFDKTGNSINYFIRDCILSYEKWTGPNNSKIAVRFMKYNSLSPEVELTDSGSLNINPAVAYHMGFPAENNKGAVVFQSNRSGNWDIYFSYYDTVSWSAPVAVASDVMDETNPSIVSFINTTNSNFLIAYKKGNDICLRNLHNGIWLDEVNVTSSDSLVCSSPVLTSLVFLQGYFFLAYQRTTNGTNKSISYHSVQISPSGALDIGTRVTIYQPNSQDNIRFSNGVNNCILNYDYDTLGTKHFYSAFLEGNNYSMWNQTSNYNGYNYGGTGSSHGDITSDYPNGYSLVSWINKNNDSTRIFIYQIGFGNNLSKFYVGDSNSETFVNTSSKLVFGNMYRVRILWEKIINGRMALIESFRDAVLTPIKTISNSVPDKIALFQNYPNPFNPKTIINYQLPKTNYVYMKVYNVLGNEVATLVNEKQNAGSYTVEFDGSNLSSGIYFYKLEAEGFTETKRMILLK